MKQQYLLAIDQGTTGTHAMIVDRDLRVKASVTHEFTQIFPRPGWVEHRADDIWLSLKNAVAQAIKDASIAASEIAAIGITNQRETTCLFDRQSRPIHNWIVWQCRRSGSICDELRKAGYEETVTKKTGLLIDPYFSATKIMWLLRENPQWGKLAQRKEILFGTIDTWLVHRMTAGVVHVTDATNASRTMLMDLKTCQWDPQLLEITNVPRGMLPEIRSSAEIYGYTKGLDFLPDGIPISGIAGDQQAALFGQACFEKGQAKATYGTGSFLLMNTGDQPVWSRNRLLSSVAIQIGSEVQYCLEGSAFIAGAAIQWLRDGLGLIKSSAETETLAASVDDTGDVVFVPAMAGLGAPHWRPDARGLFCGISRDTTKGHLVRAVLEGIALQNRDILEAMQADAGSLKELKVDGGAVRNNFLMQFQADVLGVSCIRPKVIETTAFGAAVLAGLGVGIFANREVVKKAWAADRVFEPKANKIWLEEKIAKYKRAVERA